MIDVTFSWRLVLFCFVSFMIVYNYDADLEVSDTCVRSSLLSWVELSCLLCNTKLLAGWMTDDGRYGSMSVSWHRSGRSWCSLPSARHRRKTKGVSLANGIAVRRMFCVDFCSGHYFVYFCLWPLFACTEPAVATKCGSLKFRKYVTGSLSVVQTKVSNQITSTFAYANVNKTNTSWMTS